MGARIRFSTASAFVSGRSAAIAAASACRNFRSEPEDPWLVTA